MKQIFEDHYFSLLSNFDFRQVHDDVEVFSDNGTVFCSVLSIDDLYVLFEGQDSEEAALDYLAVSSS